MPQAAQAVAASADLELGPHRGGAIGDRIRWASRRMRQPLTR
ncbi:MAG TPA: hypothetical protein VNW50_17280 [Streptosporangiaceae bacterium]|nr:hypothetical protein [Streptosporangiaceae bacterium]